MGTLGAAKACGVVGMLAVVASMFKPTWAPFTAPTYALCKGVAMAGMSAVLEMSYPGTVLMGCRTKAWVGAARQGRFCCRNANEGGQLAV